MLPLIRLEGDFEIRDEKSYCKKESASETNKKLLLKHTWLENLVF